MQRINGIPPLNISGEKIMDNPLRWFEIATTNLDRAVAFYQNILAIELRRDTCGGIAMAIFPYAEPYPSGALVAMPQLQPRDNGTLIYLDGGADLNVVLARIPPAGGQVVMGKTDLGNNIGHIALFIDCEGNRVGLYSKD
ncbi:VOC family protein [Ferribacterium limneticum]|uniref:VOC family protein n=1 Tax=Ferribacterium limneticum TaxID=76259 RepID=UPI001CFBB4CD|nr:VOC family protein [Ferribacterium limneticum]UCV18132.1 VOC family protein [Ferribacterium limneticum]